MQMASIPGKPENSVIPFLYPDFCTGTLSCANVSERKTQDSRLKTQDSRLKTQDIYFEQPADFRTCKITFFIRQEICRDERSCSRSIVPGRPHFVRVPDTFFQPDTGSTSKKQSILFYFQPKLPVLLPVKTTTIERSGK